MNSEKSKPKITSSDGDEEDVAISVEVATRRPFMKLAFTEFSEKKSRQKLLSL